MPAASALEPRASTLAVRLRASLDDVEALADAALPALRPERGRRRLCRRAIGIRLCGTARWDLAIARTAPLALERTAHDPALLVARLPLAVTGTAGIDGPLARALRLDAIEVDALADVRLSIDVEVGPDWCPRVRVALEHRWRHPPALTWVAGLELDVAGAVDAAIERELAGLGPRIDRAIDCEAARARLATEWRARAVELELPEFGAAWLNLEPAGFAFSGLVREGDALGLAFALEARAALEDAPVEARELALPALRTTGFAAPERTGIELLVRLGWERLERAAGAALVGREFTARAGPGRATLRPTEVSLSGVRGAAGPEGPGEPAIGLSVAFEADLPGRRRPVRGRLHLAASPTLDPATRTLRLRDVRVAPVLDGALWSRLGPLVESRLVAALDERASIPLGDRLDALGDRLAARLADPARTGGLVVRTEGVSLGLGRVAVGRDALALEVRAAGALDVEVPGGALEAALGR